MNVRYFSSFRLKPNIDGEISLGSHWHERNLHFYRMTTPIHFELFRSLTKDDAVRHGHLDLLGEDLIHVFVFCQPHRTHEPLFWVLRIGQNLYIRGREHVNSYKYSNKRRSYLIVK